MTTISFFIELAGILTTDGAAVKACGTPGLFLAQAQQKGARHAQRWGRHATSIAAGRAKESTTRAKRGATRDIFCPPGEKRSTSTRKDGASCDIDCRRSCKREHVTRKDGCDTRHLLLQVWQKMARPAQIQCGVPRNCLQQSEAPDERKFPSSRAATPLRRGVFAKSVSVSLCQHHTSR